MDTNSNLRGAAAAVIGARHARAARNGQDAAAVWTAGAMGAAVVCDGCGSSGSSEVGARLGAQLVLGAIQRRLIAGETAVDAAWWTGVRDEVTSTLAQIASTLPGALPDVVHELLLFTAIAAVMVGDRAYVWAVGDGAYAIDGAGCELGPFADNQPPYLAYDLLGNPPAAHLASESGVHSVMVATDGVGEVGLGRFTPDTLVRHPDALRRQLAVLARSEERIDWAAQRVMREPALLQDDGAVALLVRGAS